MSGADIVARGLAASARGVAAPLATRGLGSIGTRIFGGRSENVFALGSGTTTGRTFGVRTVTAAPGFSAVRLILAASQTAGGDAVSPSLFACAAALPDTTDAAIQAAAYGQFTFAGQGGGTLPPAPSASRRGFVLSDWLALPSVPRGDGGTLPLLDIKVYLYTAGAAGNVVMLGSSGGESFANWATRPDGRTWHMYGKGGQFAPGGAGMYPGNSLAENRSPIIGFQYLADGRVITIGGFGDSITDGRGTYLGEGFGLPAAITAQAAGSGVAYEWANLAWAGQSTANIRRNVEDALAAGLTFDMAVLPAGSPNDVAVKPPSAAQMAGYVAGMRGNIALAQVALQAKGIPAIIWPWMPTNTAVNAYGAQDAQRRAYADTVRARAQRGAVIADIDAAMAGATDGSGQTQMRAGSTTDGIHPNDAGNALMAATIARAVQRAMQPVAGTLVA